MHLTWSYVLRRFVLLWFVIRCRALLAPIAIMVLYSQLINRDVCFATSNSQLSLVHFALHFHFCNRLATLGLVFNCISP